MRLLTHPHHDHRRFRRWIRPAAVALAATAGTAGIERHLIASLAAPLAPPLTFDHLLVRGAQVMLALGLLWAWLAVIAAVHDAVRTAALAPTTRSATAPGLGRRALALPLPARQLVVLLCGLALTSTAAPALAAPTSADHAGPGTTRLTAIAATLPFPDRATDAAPLRPPPNAHVTVQPGQSLWSITAALIASDDPDQIECGWQRLYRHNRSQIGPDPDRIAPGLRLSVPESLR